MSKIDVAVLIAFLLAVVLIVIWGSNSITPSKEAMKHFREHSNYIRNTIDLRCEKCGVLWGKSNRTCLECGGNEIGAYQKSDRENIDALIQNKKCSDKAKNPIKRKEK